MFYNTGVDTTPSGMGHPDSVFAVEHHAKTVRGKDGQREAGIRRPYGISITRISG
jgi:hypothetical protein